MDTNTIIYLRRQQNALAARFALVATAIDAIFSIKITVTEAMAKASAKAWEHAYRHTEGYGNDDPPDFDVDIGKEILVASKDFFFPLIPDEVQFAAGNLAHNLASIKRYSTALAPVSGTLAFVPPTSDNWLQSEIDVVLQSYRARITAATTQLRDINTYCHYLNQTESRLPGFIKPALTGLFGSADHDTGFTYTDQDFKYQPRGERMKVLSARWLAPFIGLMKATIIEDSLRVITKTSTPLSGEPPTMTHFGSHVSNAIKVFDD